MIRVTIEYTDNLGPEADKWTPAFRNALSTFDS